ncbi:hypothetical protein [Paraburkholderia nodosa]|uniref:hypothetical protein n=1 Tax=Paraburkholderia nodosa TaxID=392320 RepID=UPI0008418E2E|nr:hypothetical protein [Paraburkholderia nodosa]
MDALIAVQRAQRLDTLAASSDGRSKTAQLRDVFESVERAIRSGVRYAAIIQELAATGLVFTYQTFALTLKRIRRERGIVSRLTRAPQAETGPAVSRAPADVPRQAANPVAAERGVPDSETGVAPAVAAARPAVRERRPIAPVGAKLPDDWLTAELTLEQKHLLTHEQRIARADAKVKQYWPNPFDPVPPEKDQPA